MGVIKTSGSVLLHLIVGIIVFSPYTAIQGEALPFSVDLTRLQYQDGAGREIDYNFSSGNSDPSGVIQIPTAAIIQRPAAESGTTYLWEPIDGITQQLGAGYCRMSIPQADITMPPVPTAAITVDGNVADWTAVPVYLQDENTGDDYVDVPGSDLEYIKLAYDAGRTRLYFLLKVTDAISEEFLYRTVLAASVYETRWPGSVQADFLLVDGEWDVASFRCAQDYQWYSVSEQGEVAVSGAFIEASVSIAALSITEPFYLVGETLDAWDYWYDHFQAVEPEVEGLSALGANGPVVDAAQDWQFQVRLGNFANTGAEQHDYSVTIGGGTSAEQYEDTTTPQSTITVDGSAGDWASIESAILVAQTDYSGTPDADIQRVCTAMDNTYFYFMVQIGAALDAGDVSDVLINFNCRDGDEYFLEGQYDDLGLDVWLPDEEVYLQTESNWVLLDGATVAVGQVVEVRIPKSAFDHDGYFNATYLNMWKWSSAEGEDPIWVDPVISPSVEFGFFTGYHEGTYYEDVLHIVADINSELESVQAESQEVILTGLDPTTATIDVSVQVTSGQLLNMRYRINDGQWQSLWQYVLPAGRMLSFAALYPYVELNTEHHEPGELSLTVSGTITDAHTGMPLPDIQVGCWNHDAQEYQGTRTDPLGEYELTDLSPGDVSMMIEPDWDSPYARMGRDMDLTTDATGVDFALPQGATLSGRLVDAQTAEPVYNVRIDYWSERYEIWQNAWSDADGHFTLTHLPPGMGDLGVESWSDPSRIWLSWPANLIYLEEGQIVDGRVMALRRGVRVWGYVKDTSGQPVPWLEIDFDGPAYEGDTDTDSDGRYELYLPPGTYVARPDFDSDDPPMDQWTSVRTDVTVPESGEVQAPDIIAYSYATGEQISGTVANSGDWGTRQPHVVALPAGTSVTPETFATVGEVCGTVPSETGAFTIPILPPGSYDVYLSAEQYGADDTGSFLICDRALNVSTGTSNLALAAALGQGALQGAVLNAARVPVLGADLFLANAGTGEFVGGGESGPQGLFAISDMTAGTYTLTVMHPKYQRVQTTVVVADGSVTKVDAIAMPFAGIAEAADLNGDAVTDVADLAMLAAQWLDAGTADFDQSGAVTLVDLARMADLWQMQAMWTLTGEAREPALVGHWRMDDDAESIAIVDSSGHGRHGTAARHTQDLSTAGMVGGAIAFNGTGDFVDLGADAALLPEAWTVAAWVLCEDAATATLFSFGGNYPAVKMQHNNSHRPIIYMSDRSYREFDPSAYATLMDGSWHHVAFSLPGADGAAAADAQMYLDGAAVPAIATAASGPQAAKSRASIGTNRVGGTQYFKGAIDEVRLYARVLSSSEIAALYAQDMR